MKKRIAAGVLWFFVTWYAWNVIGWMTGLAAGVGPLLGFAVALLIAGDPFGRIWTTRSSAAPMVAATPSTEAG
jgi:hypothetical protein